MIRTKSGWNLVGLVLISFSIAIQSCGDTDYCTQVLNDTGRITDGVIVTLTTNKDTFTAGETVQLALTVANTTEQPIVVLMGAPDSEFYVLDDTGTEVWNWSSYNNASYIAGLWYETFEPCAYYPLVWSNAQGVRTETWNGEDNDHNPLPPGTYTVYAGFASDPRYESNRKVIELK